MKEEERKEGRKKGRDGEKMKGRETRVGKEDRREGRKKGSKEGKGKREKMRGEEGRREGGKEGLTVYLLFPTFLVLNFYSRLCSC